MPRQTPQQLQEAKRARQAEREAEEAAAAEREAWLLDARRRHGRIANVANGLYDELDKIAKKWPTMLVTERTVTRVNKLLASTRELLQAEEDEFADGLEEIVPAGDLPETRDIVLILRETKDALTRFWRRYHQEWDELEDDEGEW